MPKKLLPGLDRLIDRDEVKRRTGWSDATLYRMARTGKITPYHFKGSRIARYDLDEIEALVVVGGARSTAGGAA